MKPSNSTNRASPLSLALVMLALVANLAVPLWTLLRAIREPGYATRVRDHMAAMPPLSEVGTQLEEAAATCAKRIVAPLPLRPTDRADFDVALDLASRESVRRWAFVLPVALSGFLLVLGAALAACSHWSTAYKGDRWYSPLATSQGKRWAFACGGLSALLPPLLLALTRDPASALQLSLGLNALAAAAIYVYLSRLPHRL